MRERGVVALGVAEAFDGRHGDEVGLAGVVGARSTDADVGLGVGEERLGVVDAGRAGMLGLGPRIKNAPVSLRSARR